MNKVLDRLKDLRKVMAQQDVQAVIIPTSDYHDTEYVCEYFQERVEFSGFTGSAGTLVVLKDKAALWTDGRYFIQAARELEGSGIELMKAGMPGTPSIEEWIVENLKPNETVAFDGRCVSYNDYEKYRKCFARHDLKMKTDTDFPGLVWTDRPAMPASTTFPLGEEFTGESMESKLDRVRKVLAEKNADGFVTTKIDDIGWLLNMRADDIPSFPEALCYFLLTRDGGALYINSDRLDDVTRWHLEDANIDIRPYDSIYHDASYLEGKTLVDPALTNTSIVMSLKEPVFDTDPVILMKAVKNPVEQEGFRKAHIKDGVAMTKFLHWLKTNIGIEKMTETSAAKKLHEFREQQPDFLEDSFTTISAYGPNAAMPHYHPDESKPVEIQNRSFYLVDSGGHYLDGTTDITRTFVMGPLTDKERHMFTRVLQGHIRLAKAKFLKGVRGMNLDILARGPLWDEGLDFNHGTGHGVGMVSNVHEAPNGFRWRVVPERNDSAILEPGMITSDEPGIYLEGEFGIRHENLLLCTEAFKTPYGEYLQHETLTLVPFDKEGLDVDLMDRSEIEWLNDYHRKVFETLSPYMSKEEGEWLEEVCSPILI